MEGKIHEINEIIKLIQEEYADAETFITNSLMELHELHHSISRENEQLGEKRTKQLEKIYEILNEAGCNTEID